MRTADRVTRFIREILSRSVVVIVYSKCNKNIADDTDRLEEEKEPTKHHSRAYTLSLGFVSPTANIDRNSFFANKFQRKMVENEAVLWKSTCTAKSCFLARRKFCAHLFYIKTYKSLRTEWLTKLFTNFSKRNRAPSAVTVSHTHTVLHSCMLCSTMFHLPCACDFCQLYNLHHDVNCFRRRLNGVQ